MADPKKDDDNILKEIEESLFEEFNEQVRLTEPTDSRLQPNVELNPDMGPKVAAAPSTASPPSETPVAPESVGVNEDVKVKIEAEKAKAKEESVALGAVFSTVVEEDIAKEVPVEPEPEVLQFPRTWNPIKIAKYAIAKTKELQIFSKLFHLLKLGAVATFYPIKYFLQLTTRQKSYLFIIFGILATFCYFSWDFYQKILHPVKKSIYLLSFQELEGKSYSFAEQEKREVFFSPAYTPDYAFVIPKVIVNIKRSSNSSDTPMVLAEFIFKASNQETAIEFKDRKVEMQDIASRTLEEYDYDTLREAKGIIALRKDIARNVNPVLNHGIVVDVLYKTFIVKP